MSNMSIAYQSLRRLHDYVTPADNSEDFLLGGGCDAGPLPLEKEDDGSGDDDAPRGPGMLPPASKASSSSTPALKAAPRAPPPKPSGPPLPSPPSPEFLVGGSSSLSESKAAPKAKAASKAAAAKAKSRGGKVLVPAVGEGFVYYDEYRAPLKLEPTGNWAFHCKREGCPKDCKRTLGVVRRNMRLLDHELEPLAFLHAWRDCTIDPKKGHRKSHPTDEAVKRYFEEHLDELEALAAVFGLPNTP